MSTTAQMFANLKATITDPNAASGSTLTVTPAVEPGVKTFAAGTSAGQVDLSHLKRYSPGTSGVSIDLSGTLVDEFGNAAVFARVAGLMIVNASTTPGQNVAVTGNFIAGNMGTNTVLTPGDYLSRTALDATALPVTNGSADTITLTSAAGTPAVDVGVVGRSV